MCSETNQYTSIKNFCDNKIDCLKGSDEIFCNHTFFCPIDCICTYETYVYCNYSTILSNKINFYTDNFIRILYLNNFAEDTLMIYSKKTFNSILYLNLKNLSKFIFENFQEARNLIYLNLCEMELFYLNITLFKNFKKLQNLIILKNSLKRLNSLIFKNLPIINLNIHEKYLNFILNLNNLPYLVNLNLSLLHVENIIWKNNRTLKNLTNLDIRGVNFSKKMKMNFFKIFKKLLIIYTDNFQICCLIEKFNKNINCYLTNEDDWKIFSCFDRILIKSFRTWAYFIFSSIFFGNIFCIIVQIKRYKSSIYSIHILLGLFDFLYALYIIIIIYMDSKFHSNYLEYDFIWRYGILCKIIGFTASLSIYGQCTCALIITLDRYRSFHYLFKKRSINYHLVLLVIIPFLILIAALPISSKVTKR